MKGTSKEKQKKSPIRDLLFLGATFLAAGILLLAFPHKRQVVITTSWEFFLEMILILPAIMVLIGLFAVFVPRETVVKLLGKDTGLKGFFLAIILGALPTGPLYVAFPMAAALLKKGARPSNIVIFLSAWACIKIPQELVELQFLGAKFMAMRLFLTVVFVILMGVTIEKIIEWSEGGASRA